MNEANTTTTDDGGPAYPSHGSMGEVIHTGMSLRDYFAAKAITGLLAMRTWCTVTEKYESAYKTGFIAPGGPEASDAYELARDAYEIADAMIEARKGATR